MSKVEDFLSKDEELEIVEAIRIAEVKNFGRNSCTYRKKYFLGSSRQS